MIQEMLQHLLDDIYRMEGEAVVPTTVETKPEVVKPQLPPQPKEEIWPDDDDQPKRELVLAIPKLNDLFLLTEDGMKAINAAIAEHGSGKALALHLGNTSSNPAGWISDHRRKIKKAVAQE